MPLIFLLTPAGIHAQPLGDEYEEVLVYLKVQGVGGYEISAIYAYDDNRLLLPVTDLFTLLRINQQTSDRYETVSGYLLQETKPYKINYPERYITVNHDTIRLKEKDVLKTNFGLFLHTGMYGRAFGLYCTFNFRSLSVNLKTDLELPAVRDMRLAQMRKNVEMIKGEVAVDTIIGRQYHLLRFGMVDWAVTSTQLTGSASVTRLSTAIGAELFGGETNAVINYTTNRDLDLRNQQFNWRWANNKYKLIRQVSVGKINPGSIASVYDPFYGVLVTNTPTNFRRSFGEYNFTGYTEPGWTVELYVNNVLVDYKKADASGFYTFEVPLVYGASNVVVKIYGPYGEERIREVPINIPYIFLPKGEFEYIIKSGFVDDSLKSTFSRAEANYGVNRFLTIGGGIESYSFIRNNKEVPFLSGSVSPLANLIITGEYADKVRSKGTLSYRMPSSFTLEIDYAKYVRGQEAIRFNYLEERKVTVALPLTVGILKGYTRLGFKQNVYENFSYNSVEFLISNNFGPLSANITTYANWTSGIDPFLNSTLSAALRLGRGYNVRSQAQLDLNKVEMISYRVELEKRISRKGYASVNYEENVRGGTQSINVSFRYDLPFAQANVSSRFSGDDVQTTQGMRGSFAFGSGNGYVHVDNRSVMGRGGLTLVPFLDINFNNKKDDNEPLISGLDVKINGGRFLNREKDTITRIMDLEPYTSYLLEMNNNGFENIAWQLKNKTMRVYIDPNQFKKIEIPVLPMGEVNGMVYIRSGGQLTGQGRIIVQIFTHDGKPVKELLTEADGYFTFLGLAPGKYYASLDTDQMQKLGWDYKPRKIDFTIRPSEWGDIIDNIDFTIIRNPQDRAEMPPPRKNQQKEIPSNQIIKQTDKPVPSEQLQPPQPQTMPVQEKVIEKDSVRKTTDDEPKQQLPPSDTLKKQSRFDPQAGRYYVQAASCPAVSIARNIFEKISQQSNAPAGIVKVDDAYKVRLGYFQSRSAALEAAEAMKAEGIDAFIGIAEDRDVMVIQNGNPEPYPDPDKNSSENQQKSPKPDTVQRTKQTTGTPEQQPPQIGGQNQPDPSLNSGRYYLQAGAYSGETIASQKAENLRKMTKYPVFIDEENGMYKVRIGYFDDRAKTMELLEFFETKGIASFIGIRKK